MLLIGMLFLASTITFASENLNYFKCTAHYFLVVHRDGKPDMTLYTSVTDDTCKEAMAAAKEMARDIVDEL